jgi:GAF domain-containing protein
VSIGRATLRRMSDPRSQILAEAGRAFGAAFDPVAAPWNVVHFLVPRLADWAAIGVLDPHGALHRVAHAHVSEAAAAHLANTDPVTPARSVRASAIGRVLRSGRPVVVADLADRAEFLPPSIATPGTRGLLMVPLGPRRHPIGLMVLGATEPGRFGPADARLALALALRAGVVLDIARRCQSMRQQSESLVDTPQSRRHRGEVSARARRRAELTRQLIGRE